MLISLNWIRDFVDLPVDLDPHALAERFTMTCAEVEGVEHIAIGARGLIAARVDQVEPLPGKRELHRAVLDVGSGAPVETVTAAAELTAGALVVYAPVGAHLAEVGQVGTAKVGAHQSNGMIVSGEMVGIAMAAEQAVFLPPYTVPGAALDPALFDDWVIEVDNKSITHRPDLWGHYGIAREIAAILGKPLGEYPVVDLATLTENDQPTIPIEIDAPEACARYSGLRMDCVASQPAPLWMQLRLGHVGLRPIDCLVDLTNYIMLELGQPMHAFDGDHIERIEVAWAEPGSKFTTLDGFERQMPERALMIMSDRQPVAVAGIMGGLATEVSPHTKSMLLESANFDAATVRRCTTALGLRTDASARFEKSLDPANTVMALRRFVHLAKPEFPELKLTSPLSDCYPRQAEAVEVEINVPFINGFMGHAVSNDEIAAILTPLGFGVNDQGERMTIQVPSWRATKDVAMEADIIEEVARCVGYDNIDSRLPRATVRCFDANAQHEVEQNTLREFCMNLGYNEIHRYLWYNDAWLAKLGYSPVPGIEVRNPITAQEHSLRHQLMPGMLEATDLNRHHWDAFRLIELGSVFPAGTTADAEHRHVGLISAQRKRDAEDGLLLRMKGDLETWAGQVFGRTATFSRVDGTDRLLWEHVHKSAEVRVGDVGIGTVGVLPLELRNRIDEHLKAWSIVWAELRIDHIAVPRPETRKLEPIPTHPQIDLDFSALTDASRDYVSVAGKVADFKHPLLVNVTYVGSYEGKSIPAGQRSLTFRTRIGDATRTLIDDDLNDFRQAFGAHLQKCGLVLRG